MCIYEIWDVLKHFCCVLYLLFFEKLYCWRSLTGNDYITTFDSKLLFLIVT